MAKSLIAVVHSTIKRTHRRISFLDDVDFRQWSCESNVDHADKDGHDRELQLNGGGVDFHEHTRANGQGEGVVNNTELRSFKEREW